MDPESSFETDRACAGRRFGGAQSTVGALPAAASALGERASSSLRAGARDTDDLVQDALIGTLKNFRAFEQPWRVGAAGVSAAGGHESDSRRTATIRGEGFRR